MESPAPHDPVSDEVILAYVDGNLTKEEATALEARAAGEAALAAQIALMRGLRGARERRGPAENDLEDGWSKLSQAIHRERVPSPSWLQHIRGPKWRGAAIALAASVATLGFIGLAMRAAEDRSSSYEMAQSATPGAFLAQITFVPDASEREIRGALLAAKAQITSGPSALGVYQVSFGGAEVRERGVVLLSARKDLVESIAPISSVRGP